jgi:hypothetical protein
MLRRVVLVRTEVSEEYGTSIIKVTKIVELGTTLAVTSNRRKHAAKTFSVTDSFHPYDGGANSSETSVLTRATRRNITEDGILHIHRLDNLKSYRY